MKRIEVDLNKCSGCRSCEAACNFHHTKQFGRKEGSIYVKPRNELGAVVVVIYSEKKGKARACDFCSGESAPMCVKYCHTQAITIEAR